MTTHRLLLSTTFFAAFAAQAHVTLPPGGATAGSEYPAAFRVGHACEGAASTTALNVVLSGTGWWATSSEKSGETVPPVTASRSRVPRYVPSEASVPPSPLMSSSCAR